MQLFHYEDARSNEGETGQTWRPYHLYRFSASENCVIFEVTCFSTIQHLTLSCGFLIITLFKLTMIKGHLPELTNKHSYNNILPRVTYYYV
jgi:hypothetical protein